MHLNIPFKSFHLENGLQLLLHHEGTTPITAVNLWYKVGSWNERPGKTGYAHLFEHMMFQGSAHVGSDMHFRLMQSVGGVVNGSTAFNRTNYYETLPSHHLERALWLEADRMGYLWQAMTPEKLDNQRDVVKNERRQRVDNQPYGLWLDKTLEMAFPPDYPYHWPVIGYMEDLDAAGMDDIRHFFETYYNPGNASLCIAGDFDEAQTLEWVERYFGGIPSGPMPPPVEARFDGYFSGEKREVLPDAVQLPRLYLSYHVPGMDSRDFIVAQILSAVLSGGKSARLYNELTFKRQLAQEVGCFLFPMLQTSLLMFMVTPQNGISVETMEKALQGEIDRLSLSDIGEPEIERVKNQIVAYKVRELQSVSHIADGLNQGAVLYGDADYINKELALYQAVTRSEVVAFAQKWLKDSNRVVLTFIPKNE
ncbi:MAG TPA: insulinase family protein [Caldithrix abyssi]|uniref:Insulinase family protein n=1 Tax=Caldithrix abyssi TaxID=187145 RepID=A0A7V5RNT3_CALAY|nr:insulinase family protein [Caldithrix abyssi]